MRSGEVVPPVGASLVGGWARTRWSTAWWKTDRVAGVPTDSDLVPFWGHAGGVSAVAVTPDGRSIVSGGRDDYTVRVWDRESGRERACFAGHDGPVVALAVTPDGRLVISGGDGTVRIWDLPAGREQACLTGHDGGVRAVAVTPDGQRIVSGGDDGAVRLWDLASGTTQARLVGHTGEVSAVALTPDGQGIVTGGHDGMLRLWDRRTGREQVCLRPAGTRTGLPFRPADPVSAVAVTPDGQWIVSGDMGGTVRVWDLAVGREQACLTSHNGPVWAVAVTPDGRRIVSGGGGDGTIRVWDRKSGRELARYARGWSVRRLPGHLKGVAAVAVTPDGSRIVSCGGAGGGLVRGLDPGDGTIRIWDRASGRQLACLTGHSRGVTGIAITPDGAEIVSVGSDHTIRIWDRHAKAQVRGTASGVPRQERR